MKKKLIVMLISCLAILVMVGCGVPSNVSSEVESADEPIATEEPVVTETTYDSIYDDYSAQLVERGVAVVDEFNDETDGVNDIVKLAEIATEKVQKLANIMVSGGMEMASLMTKNGDEYSVYEDNYKKLYSVYNDEAMKVYKAYMEKYADSIPGMTDSMKNQMLEQLEAGLESMAPMSE